MKSFEMAFESYPQLIMGLFIWQGLQIKETLNIVSISVSAASAIYGFGDILVGFICIINSSNSSSFTFWSNVCLIKIRGKHSSNTLMHLLRIWLRQTLVDWLLVQFASITITQWQPKLSFLLRLSKVIEEKSVFLLWVTQLIETFWNVGKTIRGFQHIDSIRLVIRK